MSSKTRDKGFTLVELMVVISIISLLIAILLPALSKARMAAQTTICLSKERQHGLAMAMYADACNGWIVVISAKLNTADPYWPKIMVDQGYLGSQMSVIGNGEKTYRDFTCPTYFSRKGANWRATNYGLNYRFADYAGSAGGNHGRMSPFGQGRRMGTGELKSFKVAKASPSDVALIGDYDPAGSGRPSIRLNLAGGGDDRLRFRHNGESSNILYFDLHAGTRSRESVPTSLSDTFWLGDATN